MDYEGPVTAAHDEEATAPAPTGPREYSIDDLAAVSRVPSRTIRFYQSKGLLPKPELKGRVAWYTDAHVERLKLVEELQDRGLQIKAIGELVSRMDKGELALDEWLGLETQFAEPWANDKPRVVDAAELRTMGGDDRPGRIAELVRARLVERRGEAFLVHSPALLQISVKLEAAGVELKAAVEAGDILRNYLGKLARELARHFVEHAGETIARGEERTSFSESLAALRPMAMEAVRIIFAQEMERTLRKMIESGTTTKLARKPQKRDK